ncbi:MAG: flagellar motor switch protein FliG [Spirochaetes bacterium]|nr:flagellar motor switch protein FliG [Spirochaetota bacterium]
MKSFDDMTWTEKAAALMIVVGRDTASEIMQHLDEETVFRISCEMSKIDKLTPEDREELLGEFLIEMKNQKFSVKGGDEVAKKMLIDSLGIDKAKKIYSRINPVKAEKRFEFLNDLDEDVIFNLLKDEHPQAISVAMVYMNRLKAAKVLKLLGRDLSKDVALRIAKMDKLSPEAVDQMAVNLKKKYEKSIQRGTASSQYQGLDKLAEIMNHLDGKTEKDLMSYLDVNLPGHAEEIRNKIYTFDHILTLTNKEIRILIEELNDDSLLSLALKGAGDEIRFKFLRNVSNNRATDILDSMNLLGAVRLNEILEARQEITSLMRELNDNGVIHIRKSDEKLVE